MSYLNEQLRSRLAPVIHRLPNRQRWLTTGPLIRIDSSRLEALLPGAALGTPCLIQHPRTVKPIRAEVIGLNGSTAYLASYDDPQGLVAGLKVACGGGASLLASSTMTLGQVIDSFGAPLPGIPLSGKECDLPGECRWRITISEQDLSTPPPPPLQREPTFQLFETGIRTIDAFCTLGLGQRIGLFAGAGVGKSTLLAAIARNSGADAIVIALVGERGREVRQFLQDGLGKVGLQRASVIVSTSDEPPLRKLRSLNLATAIAEKLRDKGLNVLLVVDSLTRVARALRDVGLARGEMPLPGGLTPSVFKTLPPILERVGAGAKGTITAIYTVLSDATEIAPDPLAEEVKSLLDGHITLNPKVAQRGIYPAIDINKSVSRFAHKLLSPDQFRQITTVRKLITRLTHDKDLLLFGGTPDAELELALTKEPEILALLRQGVEERSGFAEVMAGIAGIIGEKN